MCGINHNNTDNICEQSGKSVAPTRTSRVQVLVGVFMTLISGTSAPFSLTNFLAVNLGGWREELWTVN